MRKLLLVGIICSWCSCVILGGKARSAEAEFLPFDQKVRIASIISHRTLPLENVKFRLAIGSIVPMDIRLEAFPLEAQAIAPRLHGYGYIVVEELLAIADQNSRKIVTVFPRWGRRQKSAHLHFR
jgi:hypothetical protein